MTGAEVSVLGPSHWTASRSGRARTAERPLLRLATFAALALYGAVRWSALMKPAPTGRLLGLCAVAVALAGVGALLTERYRRFAWVAAFVAVIAMFPIAGIPFTWVRHVRIAVTADAIGQGLTALPNVLVPYLGINQWVRAVIVLGAGVLLLDAALLAAFAPRSLGDLRRAGAALPLIALAIVPMTLVKPSLPYLQGLILFALLAAFMWAERAPTRDAATAVAVVGLAGLGALIAAPRLDPGKAWINYRALAGALTPAHVDTFDWSQTYGPLHWPTHGTVVLDVHATRPEYWKTENLDAFDGVGWVEENVAPPAPTADIYPSALTQWTETITVTIRAMRTPDIVAAGTASAPTDVANGVIPAPSSGTWQAAVPLQPGDTYRVTTYDPQPNATQLAAASNSYPNTVIDGYLRIQLPAYTRSDGRRVATEAAFIPPFGQSVGYYGPTSPNPAVELSGSPYARAYALATRLAQGALTPYAFAERVQNYLSHGFTYDTSPPLSRYPIENFLFVTKSGYCQQFAGAMALLLRMGGVPARVAVGFTPGSYDSATHTWVVNDIDAHAWVEAYFPGYGWVRFDPTPPVRLPAIPASADATAHKGLANSSSVGPHGLGKTTSSTSLAQRGLSSMPVLPAIALVAAILGGVLLLARRRGPAVGRSGEELLVELDRALRRCGRPIADGVTLAALEQRFKASDDAAAYVRAIRLARYRGMLISPTRSERNALRAQLAAGLGFVGRLRAFWALPPRR